MNAVGHRTHQPGQRPKACRCETCRFTHSVQRQQAKLGRYGRKVIERLLHKWALASMDAVYWEKKFKGEWPS